MKFRFLLLYLIATLILLGAVLPFSAKAALSSSISIDAMPPNPAPNENTSIILNSYENNLDTILITWSVNGKSILSGIGKKSFSTQAPTAGSETTVTATIVLPDGDIEKK